MRRSVEPFVMLSQIYARDQWAREQFLVAKTASLTSSVCWLKRAVLSAALNSSTVLKFLNTPCAGIECAGIL